MRRSRRSVLSAAALGLALAATGCTYLSPVQTKDFYQAADGTNANIEQDGALYAGVRDAVLILEEGGTAEFHATIANYSDEETSVELAGLSGSGSIFSTAVQVPAHGTVSLGAEDGDQPVQVDAAGLSAGTILDLEVTADGQSTTISLPVLDRSLDYYQQADSAEG